MRAKPLEERLWRRVVKKRGNGCWVWTGATVGGYGVIREGTRNVLTHRVAWELTHGAIPEERYVLHRCDVRSCVRPDHLWLGTYRDNLHDAYDKGRLPQWDSAWMRARKRRLTRGKMLK
jgi:hypothetical protein